MAVYRDDNGQRRKAPPPDPFTKEEVAALLAVPNIRTVQGLRLRAIMETMYRAGLRISEVLNLRCDDVRFTGRYIRVLHSKGGKSREVPIGDILLAWLEAWAAKRPCDSDVFFCGWEGQKLYQPNVYSSITRVGQRAARKHPELELDKKRVSPHVFRHTYATELREEGADLLMIQRLLGHSSISSTQVYAHVRPQALRDFITRRESEGNYILDTT